MCLDSQPVKKLCYKRIILLKYQLEYTQNRFRYKHESNV